jgi:hypothetical protein
MFYKNLVLILVCILLSSAVQSATPEGLPQAVQAAHEALSATTLDSAACRTLADNLLRLTAAYPSSSLIPEALWLAARLKSASGCPTEAVALSKKIIGEYPLSDVAPAAFDYVWNNLTSSGVNYPACAELARSFADRQTSPPTAGRYWLLAFDAYYKINRWRDAAATAARYVQVCPSCSLSAPIMLAMADGSLKAGDTVASRTMLENFLARYPQLPQTVPARVRLAAIYRSLGEETTARENYSLAWSAFQKHTSETVYHQAEISHAAAEALWFLQAEPRREFMQMTAISTTLPEKTARVQAANLEKALTQVMLADENYTPACFNAIGDVYCQLADALLVDGYRKEKAASGENLPFVAALPEYAKATSAYMLALEKAATGHDHDDLACLDHPDWQKASVYAAEQAYDVTLGQGDVYYAWALEMKNRAPQTDPGSLGGCARFEYLAANVVPLLVQGASYTSQALDFASRGFAKNYISAATDALDLPVRTVAAELCGIHHEQTREVAAASTQLAKSFTFGLRASSNLKRADELNENFAVVNKTAARTQTVLTNLYAAVSAWPQPESSSLFWDSLTATAYYDYANLCQTMQTDLAIAVAALTPAQTDESVQRFRNKLIKLQTACATEEYASLVRWHDWSGQCDVTYPLGEKLEARLAELDPAYSGSRPDDYPSANRRKP